ncbi:MAG: hypothetical protein EBU49_14670, partial [Proteobacteria bacterium]|nr:hypothetical protein [Pseudomonadota bacterium]
MFVRRTKKLPVIFLLVGLSLAAAACVSRLFTTGYDDRTLIIHTFNLFNQKISAASTTASSSSS